MSRQTKVLCMIDLSLVPEALEILQEHVDLDYRPADREVLIKTIGEYDALWSHVDLKIDSEVLSRAKNLKVINTASTGTDHIDKEETAKRGIRILSITRDYKLLDTFTATAECAWMLLLSCRRKLKTAIGEVSQGRWRREHFFGRQLSMSTLGVLGVGRLGKMIVEYGKAFRMRVLGCDLVPFNIPGVEAVDLDTLLRQSDAVTIHIHMVPENYHLLCSKTIGKMKEGAVLVNTSRGDIIDESALLEGLESGKLSAFGGDVVHDEWRKNMLDSPLIRYSLTHDNVIITPHMGGCTYKSITDARVFSAKKLVTYLQTGEELRA